MLTRLASARRMLLCGESLAREIRQHLAGGALLSSRALLYREQHVVIQT